MLDLGLRQKRVLLVGTGAGIGRACALAFAEAGARIACVDVERDRAAEIADALRAAGAEALAVQADARRRDDVTAAVEATVCAFGGIDVCVDIIGEARWGRVLELTDTDWDDSFDLVLRHVFYLIQAVGKQLTAQATGGAIVSISSVSGLTSAPLHAAYGAAKAGLMALTRTSAMELASAGIRVNAVAPGAVLTPRVLERLTPERRIESARAIPLGRLAQPDEIAKVVVFLASDLASYVTGQTVIVDGGATAQFPLSLRA